MNIELADPITAMAEILEAQPDAIAKILEAQHSEEKAVSEQAIGSFSLNLSIENPDWEKVTITIHRAQ